MIRNYSLIFGGITGGLYLLGLLVSHSMGIAALGGFLTVYAWIPVIFLIISGGAWLLRSRSAEPLDFKSMLQYALLAYLVYELIYAGSNYYLFGFADKGLNDRLVDYLLQQSEADMKSRGAGEEQLKAAAEMADAARAPLGAMQILIGIGQNMILHFIKSAIIATITKQTATTQP